MKTKIITYLALTLVISVFSTRINGQIAKGGYMLDFSGWGNISSSNPDIPRVNIQATYMKMISDKFMVGGELYYFHSYNGRYSSGTWEHYPFNSYRISPTIRYYFSNKKLAPFASFKNELSITKFEREGPWEDNSGYRGFLGAGVNYFLGNNIALEGLVTTNLVSLGDFKGESKYISLGTGIKLFFNSSLETDIESLPDIVFRKGNIETSGSLIGFKRRFDAPTGYFHFSPNVRYFITDRFNIYGSYGFSEFRFSTNNQYVMGFGLGAEYFFKFTENLYLNIGATGTLEYDGRHFNNLFKSSNRTWSIPVSSSLNYFHKQKRIFLGVRYSYDGVKVPERGIKNAEINRYSFFAGMDYFVEDNVYFKGQLHFNTITNYDSSGPLNSGALSIGVGFIIDSNTKEVKSNKQRK